jgi:hypothetical protein
MPRLFREGGRGIVRGIEQLRKMNKEVGME